VIFQHGGATEQLAALVTATAEAPARQLEYRRAIQVGMRDLVNAIQEERTPEVGAADALSSLIVALIASG
jgi:hypothetical protein